MNFRGYKVLNEMIMEGCRHEGAILVFVW